MDLLALKIILSFVVGGAWITLVTILTEKAGSKLGGLVAGTALSYGAAVLYVPLVRSIISRAA